MLKQVSNFGFWEFEPLASVTVAAQALMEVKFFSYWVVTSDAAEQGDCERVACLELLHAVLGVVGDSDFVVAFALHDVEVTRSSHGKRS